MKKVPILSAYLFFLLFIGTVFATPPCRSERLVISEYNFNSEFSLTDNYRVLPIEYKDLVFIKVPNQYLNSNVYVYYGENLIYQAPFNSSFREFLPNTSIYETYTWETVRNLLKINQDLKSFNNSRLNFKLGDTDIGNVVLKYEPSYCGGGLGDSGIIGFLIIFSIYILPFVALFLLIVFAIKHFRHK